MSDCPTLAERDALGRGVLPAESAARVRAHDRECADCRQLAAGLEPLARWVAAPRLTLDDAAWSRVWSAVGDEIAAGRRPWWQPAVPWLAAWRLLPAGLVLVVLAAGLAPIYRSGAPAAIEMQAVRADERLEVAPDSPGFTYLSNPGAAVGHILVAAEDELAATITVTMVIDERLADLF